MMVEEFVPGRELTVSVMGDKALGVTEITTGNGILRLPSQICAGGSRHILPADLPASISAETMALAVRAHSDIGLPRRDAHRFPL